LPNEIGRFRNLRLRLARAEEEIARLRASMRGVLYKLQDCASYGAQQAHDIIERSLHKSVKLYPDKIPGEKKDPTEVK
jgi:hypothetical protein